MQYERVCKVWKENCVKVCVVNSYIPSSQKKEKKNYSLQTYNALQEAAKETTCALHNFD